MDKPVVAAERAKFERACPWYDPTPMTSRPGRYYWYNVTDDAFKVWLAARSIAPPPPPESGELAKLREDAARYRWLLVNYAFGDGYKDIDAALNDGEADKYLSPAIDAARAALPQDLAKEKE